MDSVFHIFFASLVPGVPRSEDTLLAFSTRRIQAPCARTTRRDSHMERGEVDRGLAVQRGHRRQPWRGHGVKCGWDTPRLRWTPAQVLRFPKPLVFFVLQN
ncbi:hypothetical protein MTO96_009583 [Rhipicephalus appendiculatus]